MKLPRLPERIKPFLLSLTLTAAAVGLVLIRLAANGLSAVPAAQIPGEPDLSRLQAHVRALAPEPHPCGSEANERSRQYILSTLRTEGVETTTQDAVAVNSLVKSFVASARVRNVIARLPGNPGADAVLVVGHYDSVGSGPGAADDSSAVAGMLEAVRLLKTSGPLRNDVIFLWSDGEEAGLLGAKVFADESPLMGKVRAVFNFEARGTTGPNLLFETGPASGGWVSAFLASAPHPQGTSLATTVYMFLPNNTDFTVFKDKGLPGLNFAFIGEQTSYHTRLDNADRLDPRSLRQQAVHILACARFFGRADLKGFRGEAAVFFPVIGSLVAVYSAPVALALAIVTILAVAVIMVFGARSHLLSIGKALAAMGAVLLLAVISGALAWAALLLLGAVHPEYRVLTEPYHAASYRIALGLLALVPFMLLRMLLGRRLGPVNLLAGACLAFSVLLGLTAIFLPGISYLFQWPLFFAALLLGFLLVRDRLKLPSAASHAVIVVLCLPALFIGADTFAMVSEGLSLPMTWAVCPLAALLLALAWPLFDSILDTGKKLFPVLVAAGFTAAVLAGTLAGGFNADQPRPENVVYGLDADKREAYWIACPNAISPWADQFFGERANVGPLPAFSPMMDGCMFQSPGFRQAPAPVLNLAAPLLKVVSDVPAGDGREVRLLLFSPRGARRATVFIRRPDGRLDVSIDGKDIPDVPFEKLKPSYQIMARQFDYEHWMMINLAALKEEGVSLRLAASGRTPLTIKVVDSTNALPDLPPLGFKARPPESMSASAPWALGNGTNVAKEYRF